MMPTEPWNLAPSESARAAMVAPLIARLRAGECCSVIGVGGMGKSNFARYLQLDEVRTTHLGDAFWVVLIDSNALVIDGHPAEFALLELIVHRLIREAERRAMPATFVQELDRFHSGMLAHGGQVLAVRYLERICARLCGEYGLRVVLIFDQFEDLWRDLDARLFLNLRFLRDEFKYRLIYLTITRERLQRARARGRGDTAAVEAFWELFEPHVFGLPMYNAADARLMLARIAERRGATLDDHVITTALFLSGGHPGLLRAIYWKLVDGAPADAQALLALPEVAQECAKLWGDLLPEEQQLVRRLAAGREPGDAETLAELVTTGLVRGDPPALFTLLFADYVRTRGADAGGIVVDQRQRQVWVDGRLLQQRLTPLEFSMLVFLAGRAGQVCRREEILAALYPDESLDVNDDRIDTLLRRLRDALGDDGRSPRHLITHRGVGVRLAEGRLEG
ncbi:MAG: hypothetical protein OHK0015_32360 [Chloroflexi bacterium OHK40]